ncbi:MAG: hypothetical protein MPW14_19380 [Candidatus Manganitrophus sp.]|nr:MAG: hypothetical protein MPW14_19380 [Candidatus Manganitrophus sp.]
MDDAVHVARVQADARLVEHEQRVDQRGAQRGGQVDALHLAAGERAGLAVQREVAEADVAQVPQARADLVEQQLRSPRRAAAPAAEARRRSGAALDREQHQVVHRQARQRLELLAVSIETDRQA